jgi:hypothetical protein
MENCLVKRERFAIGLRKKKKAEILDAKRALATQQEAVEKQLAQLHPAFNDSFTTTADKQGLLVSLLGESDSTADIECMLNYVCIVLDDKFQSVPSEQFLKNGLLDHLYRFIF